ncbi:septum formation initiator family protein [Microbacterium sp. NPDC089188]|uniref:FtsB family cell division protein n=1 Tax=Microbacterium sp. NPDC089188 TaxID=3154971 RepID=UPI00342DAE73
MDVDRPTLPPRKTAAPRPPAGKKVPRRQPDPTASRRPTAPPRSAGGPRVDVREWLGKVRISGFVVIMLGLVVLGTFVLVPTVGTYMDQRQQIQALRSAVALSQSEVADLQTQRERWSDPAYIRTQARERLGYTFPGEVVYLIDNDLPASATPQEQADVSEDVGQTRTDWMAQLVRSVAASGAAQVAVPSLQIGVPDPAPTEPPTG